MVPTIEQSTAAYSADDQPNVTMRTFRTGAQIGITHLNASFADETFFGQNCAPLPGSLGDGATSGDEVLGRVCVGDVFFASGW